MQKQKGLSKNLHSENSSKSDSSLDCQMSWESLPAPSHSRKADYWASSVDHGVRTAEWCFGESSSAAAQFPGVSDERKVEAGWKNSCFERYREHHAQQHAVLSRAHHLDVSEINSSSNQRNGFLFLPSSRSEARTQDLNTSLGLEGVDENASSSRITRSSDHVRRSSDVPNLTSDYSLDSQHVHHKRKASEANVGHSSGGSDSAKRAERSQSCVQQLPQGIIYPAENDGLILSNLSERMNSRIRIGGAGLSNSAFLNTTESSESSRRSLILDVEHFHPQDHGSGNQRLTGADARNVESSSSEHSSRSAIQNYFLDMNVAPRTGNGSESHHGHSISHQSPSLGSHQPRWPSTSSRRTSSSSSGSRVGNLAVSAETTTRNASRTILHPMFLPADGTQNLSDQAIGWSSASAGNLQLGGNAGPSSRSGSTAPPVSSSGWPHRSSSRHHQRLSELRRSMLYSPVTGSQAISSSNTLQANSSTLQGVVPPIPSIPDRPTRCASTSARLERHLSGGVIGVPFPMRTLPSASEGRSIMSEIRHVLNLMRRGEALRLEDMMILDHSVLLGMADIHDRHRDMRMDVDNMSYEELLALEERIGNVCTGLSEEAIAKHLKNRKYIEIISLVDDTVQEPCCICREDYVAGEDVGELDCGHDFHTNCIKQWLLQKNVCPICKTAGLKT